MIRTAGPLIALAAALAIVSLLDCVTGADDHAKGKRIFIYDSRAGNDSKVPSGDETSWSIEVKVNSTTRQNIGFLQSRIEARLIQCPVIGIIPLTHRWLNSVSLVRTELVLQGKEEGKGEYDDDCDYDNENRYYAHVKYQVKDGKPHLMAVDNQVKEWSPLLDLTTDKIVPCVERDSNDDDD